MKEKTALEAIGSTEPSTFNEFLGALGPDRPEDKDEWRDLFWRLDRLTLGGYIEVERSINNKIDTLILTESGIEYLRTLRSGSA